MDTLVLYHGGCRDGFCAAWVVSKWYNKNVIGTEFDKPNEARVCEYTQAYYGQEPPYDSYAGKRVIIVDFCYPKEVMDKICLAAETVLLLDHHKTALETIKYLQDTYKSHRFEFVYDAAHSGAGMAWNYFFKPESDSDIPWLVQYVQDRDLWVKKLPGSDEINAYISILAFNFNYWDDANSYTLDRIMSLGWGRIAEMKTEQYVREVCKNMYMVDIQEPTKDLQLILDGKVNKWSEIPTVNICQVDCSEVLHELCNMYPDSPFSLYWFKQADGLYQYGIRSVGEFDCSVVAKLFGGGGHKNAAGFQLPYLLDELQ